MFVTTINSNPLVKPSWNDSENKSSYSPSVSDIHNFAFSFDGLENLSCGFIDRRHPEDPGALSHGGVNKTRPDVCN